MPVVLVTPVLACSTRTQHRPPDTAPAAGGLSHHRLYKRLFLGGSRGWFPLGIREPPLPRLLCPAPHSRSNPDTMKVSRYQRMVTEITVKHQFLSKMWPFHTPHAAGAVAVIGGEEKDARNCWERVTGGGLTTSRLSTAPLHCVVGYHSGQGVKIRASREWKAQNCLRTE